MVLSSKNGSIPSGYFKFSCPIVALFLVSLSVISVKFALAEILPYPPLGRDDSTAETYNGVRIVDPYRWLSRKKNWPAIYRYIKDQDELTQLVLTRCRNRKSYEEIVGKVRQSANYINGNKINGKYYFIESLGDKRNLYVQESLNSQATKIDVIATDGNKLGNGGGTQGLFLQYNSTDSFSLQVVNISDPSKPVIIGKTDALRKGFDWARNPSPNDDDAGTIGIFYTQYVNADTTAIFHEQVGRTDGRGKSVILKDFCGQNYTKSCSIETLHSTDDGNYIAIAASTWESAKRIYIYSILRLNPSNMSESELTHIRTGRPQPTFGIKLAFFAYKNHTFYFTDRETLPNSILSYNVKSRNSTIVFNLSKGDVISRATAVDQDKMLITYYLQSNFDETTIPWTYPFDLIDDMKNELRYLTNGSLILELPQKQFEKFWFTSSIYDKEVILEKRTFWEHAELYSWTVGTNPTEYIPFKKQPLGIFHDVVTINSTSGRTVSVFWNSQCNDAKKNPRSIFLLCGSSPFDIDYLSLIRDSCSQLVVYKANVTEDRLEDISAEDFILNGVRETNFVLETGAYFHKKNPADRIILIGLRQGATWVANALNAAEMSLFTAALISRSSSQSIKFQDGKSIGRFETANFNPILTLKMCHDDALNTESCSKYNSSIATLALRNYPLVNIKPGDSKPYPPIFLHINPEEYGKKAFHTFEIESVKYMAEMQHQIDNGGGKGGPFLLLKDVDADWQKFEYSNGVSRMEDFMCLLEMW